MYLLGLRTVKLLQKPTDMSADMILSKKLIEALISIILTIRSEPPLINADRKCQNLENNYHKSLKTNKYFENRPDPLTLLPNELLILNIFRRFDSHGTFQVVYISKLSHVQNSNLQCKFTKIQPFFGINFTYIPGQIYCIFTWTDITQ